MGATAAVHPADPILQAYGLGKLDDVSSASVSQHLERCDSCQQRVAEVSSDEFLGRIQQAEAVPDKGASEWAPSARSSTEGTSGPDVPPPPADTLPPELVDHADWEIIRELGRGGMGVVYLAKNRLMGRMEVLKVVGRHLIERPGVFERFRREIQSAARLQHTNIVTAYTAVRLGSSLVFAMEYVDGLDLARIVKTKGPLPIAHAAYFTHQVALGLQHAHDRGMVHRDIKPANLILARDGKKSIVKVLDFGLAKVTSEGQTDSDLTREGQMVGTPDYIAPEQIRDAKSADIRADIYSLGCTLYYLLTGSPPFRREHLFDVYKDHESTVATPLNLLRPEVPVELAAVAAKMMAKEPARRFQTPAQVAQALVPFFKTTGSTAQRPANEMAQAEEPTRQSMQVEAPTAPAQPGTIHSSAGSPVAQVSPRLQRAEPKWESLIEFKETEPLTEIAPRPVAVPKVPRRAQTWLAAASAVVLLGLLGTWIALDNMASRPNGSGQERVPSKSPELVPETGPVSGGVPKDTKSNELGSSQIVSGEWHVDGDDLAQNSIGMNFVLIPADEFMMGSPNSDPDAEPDERPQHRVRISRPFYLDTHEVTQAQYRAVTRVNPSSFSSTGKDAAAVAGNSTEACPVECVSWFDAVDFCNELSWAEGIKPFYEFDGDTVRVVDWNGSGYRLPTEAEWEYACRAGALTRYSFGEDPAQLSDHAWYRDNSGGHTHAVGQLVANKLGLFDMHGNVEEWCWNGASEGYDTPSPNYDPLGPSPPALRVIRGGTWRGGPEIARSAARYGIPLEFRGNFLGFRVARNQAKAAEPLDRKTDRILTESDAQTAEITGFDEPSGPSGLVPLFNGTDLKGWSAGVNRQTIDPSRVFRIEGNELVWAGERGLIASERSFGDFRLKFEYLLPAGQQDRTAFCLLKFTKGDPIRVDRVDFRVGGIFFALSNGRYTKMGGAVLNSHVSEDPAQSVIERSADAAPRVNEWNDAEIRCQGHRISFLINGRQVNSVEANRNLHGCLGFNSWDADIRFRNIRIASLGAEAGTGQKAR
jgi:serine/threonine protein kinase/formylglycine-generating enzyme required for sulfatase activity